MLSLTFRSRSCERQPEPAARSASFSPPGSMAIGLGGGEILSLIGLGVAAAATIVAFFGIALSLLIERPAPITRAEPAIATFAHGPSAVVRPAEDADRQPAASRGDALPPPHKAAEALASAPAALARTVPARVPSAPARTTLATWPRTAATPVSFPNAVTLERVAHGATISSAPRYVTAAAAHGKPTGHSRAQSQCLSPMRQRPRQPRTNQPPRPSRSSARPDPLPKSTSLLTYSAAALRGDLTSAP